MKETFSIDANLSVPKIYYLTDKHIKGEINVRHINAQFVEVEHYLMIFKLK